MVTVGLASNGTCVDCAGLTGASGVYASWDSLGSFGAGCSWLATLTGACGLNQATFGVARFPDQTVTMTFSLVTSGGGTTWQVGGVRDCWAPQTLSLVSGASDCNWPGTVTVNAIPPDLSDGPGSACLAAFLRGCPQGTLAQCLNPPFLGGPTSCCDPTGCGCGPSCPNNRCGALISPFRYTFLVSRCRCESRTACRPGSISLFGRNLIDQAEAMLDRWQRQMRPPVPATDFGPARLNLSNGNLILRLAHPVGGAFDPNPVLTYNSLTPAASEFGTGWTASHKQSLALVSGGTFNVNVTDGTGTLLHFNNLTAGQYYSPQSTDDTLVQNGDGTWTQTQPDGFQVAYDTNGRPSRLADSAGDRWTMGYDGGGRVLNLTDPYNRRTSYAYDGSNNLKRVQDAGGRISSFTVNGSGNLSRMVAPDLSVTRWSTTAPAN
jgi:YD repeat-containing protein